MNPNCFRAARRGLTLVELVVVLAILAAVTMIVVPRLETLQGNANHAVGAVSSSDTARYIQTFRASKQRMPDKWDSLMNEAGTAMWNAADTGTTPKTKGLSPKLTGASGKLSTTTLTAAEANALISAGVQTLFHVDADSTARPSDMFTVKGAALADGSTVATIHPTSSGGIKIINHIYRQNLASDSTTPNTVPAGKKLVVLGLGAQNEMIGSLMLEAPLYPNVDHSLVYGRNLVVFEVDSSKATLKAVLAADGDLQDDMTTYMSRDL